MPPIVTIIVHGTFAAHETWWQLGGTMPTFADKLEEALVRRGFAGTVWAPVLKTGLGYEAFSWSGENVHRDRVAGARKLAESLRQVAQQLGASNGDPLLVNFVAHSHGGNVVLEALRRVDSTVRPRRVVLLGTPLITYRPAWRIARLLLAAGLLLTLLGIGLFLLTGWFTEEGRSLLFAENLFIVAGLVLIAWIFWGLARGLDILVRLMAWPVMLLRGRRHGQAYGPGPSTLQRLLGAHGVVLFTSHQDEADLVLQLAAAPRHLYQELVETWPLWKRVLERIFVRPFVDELLLATAEVLLERFALGFSWLGTLFFDHEMADLARGRAYPTDVVRRIDVTEHLIPMLAVQQKAMVFPGIRHALVRAPTAERRRNLLESLKDVVGYLKEQVRLRHSLYYQSDHVLDRVAASLTDP